MTAVGRRAFLLALPATALTGCHQPEAPAVTPAPTQSAPTATPTATPTPTPSPTPSATVVDTTPVGQAITLPSATFTVQSIEQVDKIESSHPDFTPDFVPDPGGRLWLFDIDWTSTTDAAVAKECHGPDMFELHVFDITGTEMLMVDQPGMIEGQECSSGLARGQTGKWYTAFRGADADFGWAVFMDYAGGEAYVVKDPAIVLTRG
ncbi:hypothetical protein [Brachybacterium nesterenkovii]|uniref:hypothetical protein n=1 Tax=Brachybacterium nesterenkovii TaxID=47847 RepID=UPI00321BEB49